MGGPDLINLAECVVTPEEVDYLLDWCLKDGKASTIRELARAYLSQRIRTQTGFIPYEIRRPYKEKERIIVRLWDKEEMQPAEVVSVARRAYTKEGVVCGDTIKVRLLRQDVGLEEDVMREFVANYTALD